MTTHEQPRTAAGRAEVERQGRFYLWHPIDGRRDDLVKAILAIEAEVADDCDERVINAQASEHRVGYDAGYARREATDLTADNSALRGRRDALRAAEAAEDGLDVDAKQWARDQMALD